MVPEAGRGEDEKTTIKSTPPTTWVCSLLAALVGWHVFLIGMFLIIIGLSTIASDFGQKVVVGNVLFYLELAISVLVSGATGYFFGKKPYRWFSHRKPMTVFVLAGVLLLLTLLSFPMPFTYTIISG